MAKGLSFESFAGVVHTTFKTLYNWADDHPDFLQAKQIGTSLSKLRWEQRGIDGMTEKGFNTGLWYINMKNRFGWHDNVKVQAAQSEPIKLAYDPSKKLTDGVKDDRGKVKDDESTIEAEYEESSSKD